MIFQELLDQVPISDQDTEGDGLLRDVVVPGAGKEQCQKQQLPNRQHNSVRKAKY